MTIRGPLTATVIVPTSIDRGPTLELAVESVLSQTVQDLEVFIIGDGAHDVTREAARKLERRDSRVRFFDHPKHTSRGESYRHAALQQAHGRIVCYLPDRDLYFPDHVEKMARLLGKADMAHDFLCAVGEDQYSVNSSLDLQCEEDRRYFAALRVGIPLPHGAHTLEAYHRLGDGWATTPPGYPTDSYFWSKFARNRSMRCIGGWLPTVLNFPRGPHPGLSTERRLAEMRVWAERIRHPEQVEAIRQGMFEAALRDRAIQYTTQKRALFLPGLDKVRLFAAARRDSSLWKVYTRLGSPLSKKAR